MLTLSRGEGQFQFIGLVNGLSCIRRLNRYFHIFMKHTDSIRESAFETYICTGNLTSTAVVCSLSADTIRHWAKEENWAQKLQTHREKIQRHILKELYSCQIAGLKEFIKRFDYGSPCKSTRIPTDNGGKKQRVEYGANGLIFSGEELKIAWFAPSLKQKPDCYCEKLANGQVIQFAKTACTFGGFRHWFRCPDCDRRCATLYKKKKHFTCRICHRFKYARKV